MFLGLWEGMGFERGDCALEFLARLRRNLGVGDVEIDGRGVALKNNFEAFLGQAGADPHFLMSAKEANRRDLGVVHTQRDVDEDSLGSGCKVLSGRIPACGLPGGELSRGIREFQYRLAIEKMSLSF